MRLNQQTHNNKWLAFSQADPRYMSLKYTDK